MASSVRRPRSAKGTAEASTSRGNSTPPPTAGKSRPCESQSTVALSLAATRGVRYGSTTRLGPNLSRVVGAAIAASVVMTSGTGAGEERRSESQIESTSLRSSMSQRVHRKAAPSRPGGHGPGMMPMRYLTVMVRHRTRGAPRRQGEPARPQELTGRPPTRQGRVMSGHDRRAFPRAAAAWPATGESGDGRVVSGEVVNLSLAGLKVRSDTEAAVNSIVTVRVTLPGDAGRLEMVGTVVRRDRESIGVAFLKMSDSPAGLGTPVLPRAHMRPRSPRLPVGLLSP